MQKYTASLLIIIGLLVGTVVTEGQVNPSKSKLSLQAQALKQVLEELQARPNDVLVQKQYLERFPKDFKAFEQLFARRDFSELYDGSRYIFILRKLAPNHPLAVGEILVRLSKDAHWSADALSHLQTVTAEYAVSHTATFVNIVKKYPEKDVSSLIRYLADAENHSAYKEYPLIIQNLRKLGENKLAKQFEQAKEERIKKRDH